MMRLEPPGKRPVRLPQCADASRILACGFDLEAVTDDPRIAQQAIDVGRSEGGDAIDCEIDKGGTKRRSLLEDRRPGKPGLIDFEHQPLEQHALLVTGK